MNVETHRLPSGIFAALAGGGGGPEAVRRLAAVRNSRNRLLLHLLAERAEETGHPTAAVVREAHQTLVSLEQQAPRAVDFVVNYPAVSVWLLDTATQLDGDVPAAAQPARLAAVTAAAAVRASVTATIHIPAQARAGEVVRLPSLGAARLPPGPVRITTSPDVAVLAAGGRRIELPRVPARQEHDWRGLPELSAEHAGLRLDLLVDGWEPGQLGDSVVVGPHELDRREVQRWQTVLSGGWRLLVSYHHAVAAEVAAVHRMLVPLRSSHRTQASSTPTDAFGCVAMGRPADPRTAALTLAHEVQHAKLSVLTDLFPLVDDTAGQYFYAPWRPDPRPPSALLQGIYAHLGVVAFWRTQRQVGRDDVKAEVEFLRWWTGVHEAALVLLDSGLLTPIGTRFVTGILDVLKGWRFDTVSHSATVEARRLMERHRHRWQQDHGHTGVRPHSC